MLAAPRYLGKTVALIWLLKRSIKILFDLVMYNIYTLFLSSGTLPPLTVVEERGVSVTIHFGQNCPRPDVSVFVVTTTSKSQFPISDYLFQAIVPKVILLIFLQVVFNLPLQYCYFEVKYHFWMIYH